jgi:hypothetical protein
MTPAQHREWARILHSKGKPEKAELHEQLARAIERQRAEHNANRVPPFESSGAKKAPRERG